MARVGAQPPAVARGTIVPEPAGRGPAALIGLDAALIVARDAEAVMGSFPADHMIEDVRSFQEALRLAEKLAQDGLLVALGIQPTYPETGSGYIRFGAPLEHGSGLGAHVADAFVEKPRLHVAEEYLRAGNYVWNAGIFVPRAGRILEEIRRCIPSLAEVLDEIGTVAARSGGRVTDEVDHTIAALWQRLHDTITIDNGIMEHAQRIAVIPVSVGWNDIGSWASVATLYQPDASGNVIVGLEPQRHLEVATHDTLVFSTTGRTIATAGVDGLIIVDTGDRLLVCSKEHAQLVKDIAEHMREHPDV